MPTHWTRLSLYRCREEELVLVKDMHAGMRLQARIDGLRESLGRAPTTADLSMLTGMQASQVSQQLVLGLQAKHALVHANKRLVFKLAHSCQWDGGVPFEDCVMVSEHCLRIQKLCSIGWRGIQQSSVQCLRIVVLTQ